MRFSCEGCSAKYMISDDKVGPGGVKVRCKKCGHVTLVRRGEPEGAVTPAPARPPFGRMVGGHRRAARGPGGGRGAPAPLGPGRDRPGEPGLVLRAPRVGAPLLGARASLPPRRRHARGPSGRGPCPPRPRRLPPRPTRPTTSGAPGRPPRWPRSRTPVRRTWTSRPSRPPPDRMRSRPPRRTPTEGHGRRDRPHRGEAPAHGRARADGGEAHLHHSGDARPEGPAAAFRSPPESRSLTVVLLVALAVVAVVAAGLWWMTK